MTYSSRSNKIINFENFVRNFGNFDNFVPVFVIMNNGLLRRLFDIRKFSSEILRVVVP